MQILFLDPLETAVVDVVAWIAIHLSLGYLSSKIPLARLDPNRRFFQAFAWEKNGEIYQQLFGVKYWKHFMPNGSALYPGAFSIRNLLSFDPAYLEVWLQESVRAETCHWAMIFPGVFFFLWNSVAGGWGMVAYAVLNNVVPIILQRFNRPRVRRLLARLQMESSQKGAVDVVNAPPQALSHSYG